MSRETFLHREYKHQPNSTREGKVELSASPCEPMLDVFTYKGHSRNVLSLKSTRNWKLSGDGINLSALCAIGYKYQNTKYTDKSTVFQWISSVQKKNKTQHHHFSISDSVSSRCSQYQNLHAIRRKKAIKKCNSTPATRGQNSGN